MSFGQNEMCVPAEEGTRGIPPYLHFLSDLFPEQLGFVIYSAQEVVFFFSPQTLYFKNLTFGPDVEYKFPNLNHSFLY